MGDIDSLILSNVLFGNQLVEAMRVNEVVCLVNTGTSWKHFNSDEYNPVCLYAATKQAFEAILEYYVRVCSNRVITLDLFDTYGPNDPRQKLLQLLKKSARLGATLDMSPGDQLINIVHIDDVIEAYLIAAKLLLDDEEPRHERYVVSAGQPLPLKELVRIYTEATGHTVSVNWGSRPYRQREVMVPWTGGKLLPGWSPATDLIAGFQSLSEKSP